MNSIYVIVMYSNVHYVW